MRNAGFTLVELMVSLAVVLLVVAGTTAVITYQSSLSAYHIKAANAQQAVETALLIIRNDLLQAGGPSGAKWVNNKLFVKYNGFINFENPSSTPAWQIVTTDGSFTMDKFPLLIRYDISNKRADFLGVLYFPPDVCDENPEASVLQEVKETTSTLDNITHSLQFKANPLPPNNSHASPAIVYEFDNTKTPGTLFRNGIVILGGNNSDISVTSFSPVKPSGATEPAMSSWSVYVGYDWTPPFSSPSPVTKTGFQKVQSNQSVSVGKVRWLMRIGG
jgi:prepilin-type N-terminal cleavage/methylation domain-containing protein